MKGEKKKCKSCRYFRVYYCVRGFYSFPFQDDKGFCCFWGTVTETRHSCEKWFSHRMFKKIKKRKIKPKKFCKIKR